MINIFKRIWDDIKRFWIAGVAFAIYNVIIRKLFRAFCPVLIILGIPCPGCGLTRACYRMLTLNFVKGMNLNPVAPLWIIFIIYFLVCRYMIGRKTRHFQLILAVICIVSIAVYIYRMVFIFPAYPPLVYNSRCVLGKIFPNYMKILKSILE